MTKQVPSNCNDEENRQAFIRKIMEVYDVPMNLLRYETMDTTGRGIDLIEDAE